MQCEQFYKYLFLYYQQDILFLKSILAKIKWETHRIDLLISSKIHYKSYCIKHDLHNVHFTQPFPLLLTCAFWLFHRFKNQKLAYIQDSNVRILFTSYTERIGFVGLHTNFELGQSRLSLYRYRVNRHKKRITFLYVWPYLIYCFFYVQDNDTCDGNELCRYQIFL